MTTEVRGSTVVVIPTYNERENVVRVVQRLLQLPPWLDVHVLVVDDGSPDGTGAVADELARWSNGRVQVLHRAVKDGLGRAYVAGMTVALQRGASTVIQMDADLSHPVATIPVMVAALTDGTCDVVVGSRYVPGGSAAPEWPLRRRLLSRAANYYVNQVLRLGVRDATSGFKAWRAEALAAVDLRSSTTQGYAFQIEMAYRCRRLGLVVEELPIHFSDRTTGRSKMTVGVQLEAATLPWRLRRRAALEAAAEDAAPTAATILLGR